MEIQKLTKDLFLKLFQTIKLVIQSTEQVSWAKAPKSNSIWLRLPRWSRNNAKAGQLKNWNLWLQSCPLMNIFARSLSIDIE